MKIQRLIGCLIIIFCACSIVNYAEGTAPIIGESERVYTLEPANQEIRGLAFDDVSKDGPILYVLDGSGKIFLYGVHEKSQDLSFLRMLELPAGENSNPIESPRGLAFVLENGQAILYFLNWTKTGGEAKSQLWRYNQVTQESSIRDLSLFAFKLGERETLDLSYSNGKLLVSFDASGYLEQNLRIKRGIVQLEWNQAYDGKLEFIKHLPDSGFMPSRGLAHMEMEGARYYWGTVGSDFIYSADALTGRGLFHFKIPGSKQKNNSYWGLTFGDQSLWVSESASGPDRIHRVNVTRNLNASYEGPRMLRHLVMTINTRPEKDHPDPGKVYHYYSRPYAHEVLNNQGVWPNTEKLMDVSNVPNGTLKKFTYDPAGDKTSRQYMGLAEYASSSARSYSSQYEVDLWTNPYRKFVYPHRVNKNTKALAGMNYLEDDSELFNLKDTDTYDSFIIRVKTYIEKQYGVPADMESPYWAVRNCLEYIQDHYYYPSRPKRKPAAVDYDRQHYDANPGNLKIDLSRNPYDKSQIIACSGTSVMLAGIMRYLGFPARWLGTGTEKSPALWDANGNGLLDEDEAAPVSSGHRYSQVWLGNNYGWICFDATPTKPPFMDYDPHPPMQPQWRFMNRAAAGHLKDKRIVFNVGSGLFRPLYRDFEYDERLAVDNNCGGDQRYNLQGRFEKPGLWKLSRHRISVKNLCFIKDISLSGPKDKTKLTWLLKGDWNKDPEARLSVFLQQLQPGNKKLADIAVLAEGIAYDAGYTQVDLTPYNGAQYRICIRKVGDVETGGQSKTFTLE